MTSKFSQHKPALTLVSSAAAESRLNTTGVGNAGHASGGDIDQARHQLWRVLKAELRPDLTVEDASHLWLYLFDEPNPRMAYLHDDLNELRRAGLDALPRLGNKPVGIVLADAKIFVARFPELADAVPLMLAYEGVQPYTHGLPRVFKAALPAPKSRSRSAHLSVVATNPALKRW